MNDELTDQDIRAAFVARSQGSPAPDLAVRIRSAAASTRQEHPLITLPAGRFIAVRQLALAAALGAAVLVVASSMLSGVGDRPGGGLTDPSTPPTVPASPGPASPGPLSPSPSAPSSAVPSVPPQTTYTPGSVVRIATPSALDLYAEADATSDRRGQVPPGTTVYIVAAETVDGASWYQVQPFDFDLERFPLGWMPGADAAGADVLEPTALECPNGSLVPAAVHGLTPTGALACFGDDSITITGRVFCMTNDDLPEDLQHRVTGPFWLDDGRYCAFQSQDGEPYFEIIGFPTDELPPDWRTSDLVVAGHFDDPESVDCVGVPGADQLSDEAAVLECRTMFNADGVTSAGG